MDDPLIDFPQNEGILEAPEVVENASGNIVIVRPFDARHIKVALFDLDGTLSNERLGWQNLMVANNVAFLIALSLPHLHHKIAEKLVIEDIEKTIGIPTYVQMKRLVQIIEKNGYAGESLDPVILKNAYNSALVALVSQRRANSNPAQLRLRGALDLVRHLSSKLEKGVYLASGTDQGAVAESVGYLGFSPFFPPERIAGAGQLNPAADTKQQVIAKLLDAHHLAGESLLTFGDGFPEILHTHKSGGIAIGVVSRDESYYEQRGHFTIARKERRLIAAGAHIIVRQPYHDVPLLLEVIERGFPALK